MDIHQYCDHRAYELRTSTLSYIPRGDRDTYIETILNDYRREARLARVSTSAQRKLPPPPPARLHEGMKTSMRATPNPCFSTPTSYGSSNATLLQKQRKAEAQALRNATKAAAGGSAGSSRKLPW